MFMYVCMYVCMYMYDACMLLCVCVCVYQQQMKYSTSLYYFPLLFLFILPTAFSLRTLYSLHIHSFSFTPYLSHFDSSFIRLCLTLFIYCLFTHYLLFLVCRLISPTFLPSHQSYTLSLLPSHLTHNVSLTVSPLQLQTLLLIPHPVIRYHFVINPFSVEAHITCSCQFIIVRVVTRKLHNFKYLYCSSIAY